MDKGNTENLEQIRERICSIREKYNPQEDIKFAERVTSLLSLYDPRNTFANALKKFYDLRSEERTVIRTSYEVLVQDKEDSNKVGLIPHGLINDLEELGPNKVIRTTVPDISDLSYEKVRESLYLYDNPPVSRYYKLRDTLEKTVGTIGFLSLMGTTYLVLQNFFPLPKIPIPEFIKDFSNDHPIVAFSILISLPPVLMIAPVLTRFSTWGAYDVARNNLPDEIKMRKYALERLYNNAKKADNFMRYNRRIEKSFERMRSSGEVYIDLDDLETVEKMIKIYPNSLDTRL